MKTKKLLVILIAVVMLASMTACTSASPTTAQSAAASAAPTTAASAAQSASPTAASTTTAAAPTAASYLVSPSKVTISCFIVQQPSGMTDLTTNTFTTWAEKQTNVHLDMTVVQNDGSHDKLTLMLASGEYPQMICTGSTSFTNAELMKYGSTEKILIPLNDLIDKYAVNLKQRFAENSAIKAEMTALDGKIYGIPSMDSAGLGHNQVGVKLWMNVSWLKKLNLQMPTTTDDFRNVLMAFKTKDPNGNNKADEIPLTGAINTWCGDPYLFLLNAFTYFYPYNLIMLKDGKMSFTANTDGMKEGLKYIAGLYKDGLIDPAAFTQNEQQMAAIGNNKDAVIGGSATCGHLAMFVDINNLELSKQYDSILPLQGSNGYRGIPWDEPQVKGASWALTDKCPTDLQPVAMKWADLFCNYDFIVREQIGIEGTDWSAADAGSLGIDGKTPAKVKELPAHFNTQVASRNDTWGWSLDLVQPDVRDSIQLSGDIYDPTNYEGRLWQCTVKQMPYKAKVDPIPPFWMSDDDSSKINQLSTALMDYVKTSIVEFVTGKKNVDTDWQAYIDGLKKLNVDQYVQLNQSAYDALQKK